MLPIFGASEQTANVRVHERMEESIFYSPAAAKYSLGLEIGVINPAVRQTVELSTDSIKIVEIASLQ